MKHLFIGLIFVFGSFGPLFSQSVAQWRGPSRDGVYPETGLLKSWPAEGPALVWHFDGLGTGHASAAVADGRVYTAGILDGQGVIFCLDIGGKVIWKKSYGEEWTESWPGVRSTPLIWNGKVFQFSSYGKLVCLRADNGEPVWSADILREYGAPNIKWGVTENLLISGNKLICTAGGPNAALIALDAATGKLLWKCPGKGESSAYGSPALVRLPNRELIVAHTASSILGVDASNGKLLWSHDQPNKYSVHANTPLYHDGMLYCVSGYGKGGVMLKLAADGGSVTEVWRNTTLDNRMGGMVRIGDRIYGSDDVGKAWYCLDWKTGLVLGSEKVTGRGNIIAADGMLYLYGENGEIALAEPLPAGFRKVSSFRVPFGADQHWAHLVIDAGRLYVRHGKSLMVYDIKKID